MSRVAAIAVLSGLTLICLIIPSSDGMKKKAKVVKWVEMHHEPPPCHCKPKIIIEKVPYPVIEKIKIPVHHHHVVIKKKEKKKKPPKKPKPKKKKKDKKYKKMYKVSHSSHTDTCPSIELNPLTHLPTGVQEADEGGDEGDEEKYERDGEEGKRKGERERGTSHENARGDFDADGVSQLDEEVIIHTHSLVIGIDRNRIHPLLLLLFSSRTSG